jgi:hypothetical protein
MDDMAERHGAARGAAQAADRGRGADAGRGSFVEDYSIERIIETLDAEA